MDLPESLANMSLTNDSPQTKRKDYLDWQEYFMATAFLAAKRSKDPAFQVGACIVNKENRIVGVGDNSYDHHLDSLNNLFHRINCYLAVPPTNKVIPQIDELFVEYNGMPTGCSDDDFPWGKNTPSPLDSKFLYVCHAEMNAILNKNSADVKDCTIYVGLFPCNECAKMIIQSGIREVVYLSDKGAHKPIYIASKRMLHAAGVKYWQFKPRHTKIEIDFGNVDWEQMTSPSK